MPTPLSRTEAILMAALGYEVELEPPLSRIEKLLYQLVASLSNKADLVNGQIPLNELPAQTFEHMVTVQNDTARFALTTDEVQNGDSVLVDSTKIMYFVVDDTKLDREAGYQEYAAGTAAKAIADKNGNDITTTYQTLITALSKLDADLVDDSTSTNKFTNATEKQTWNGKQNAIDTTHKLDADLVDDTNATNKFTNATEKQTWNGKQNAIDSSHKLDADLIDDTTSTNKFVTAAEKTSIGTSAEKLTGVAETDDNYIEMGNGVRLYISDTEPTGTIPEGSIGIGW